MTDRILIIGPPRSGKSTLAREFRGAGLPTYCTDKRSNAHPPEDDVTYLPERLDWSAGSQYVAEKWLTMPGSWCIEGVAVVRALRKARAIPEARIIRLGHMYGEQTKGQAAMARGIETIWSEVAPRLRGVEYR